MYKTEYTPFNTFSKDKSVQAELKNYNKNNFKDHDIDYHQILHQPDDLQIPTWSKYISFARRKGVYQVLKEFLVPFRFPVQKGISQLASYKAATLRGQSTRYIEEATGLILEQPDALQLEMYDGIAGKIPVLIVEDPKDFEAVVCALVYKNEPVDLPQSMGASMINGLNNWERIHKLRDEWKEEKPNGNWPLFFRKNILPHKSLYQDKLIVLSKKPYSGVVAEELGLNEEQWLEDSLKIRLEHECTHYFTFLHLGGMYTHLHDELIADYMGITKVLGSFDSDLFLTFMGLNDKKYKKGSRMENYLIKAGLSKRATLALENMIRSASKNVAIFHKSIDSSNTKKERIAQLLSLSSLRLDEIASQNGNLLLLEHYRRITENFPMQG